MNYEVTIVGAGPAGIFAALTLAELGIGPVLLLEQGRNLDQRERKQANGMLCGWGGAGAYSDGKLTLSPEVGGFLGEFLEPQILNQLLQKTDRIWVDHGAPETIFGEASPQLEDLADRARLADLELIPSRIRHIGTENCLTVLDGLEKAIAEKVDIRTDCPVENLLAQSGQIKGVKLATGEKISSRFVIAAPGRSGAGWMKTEAESLGLDTQASPVDIGVRVELPAPVFKEITDIIYESKLIYYSKTFDDKVRTFCMNPYGEVVTEKSSEILTVNGHSYAGRKTENTNFAILVSSAFTEPFDDPIAYGFYIARLANLLGKGPASRSPRR